VWKDGWFYAFLPVPPLPQPTTLPSPSASASTPCPSPCTTWRRRCGHHVSRLLWVRKLRPGNSIVGGVVLRYSPPCPCTRSLYTCPPPRPVLALSPPPHTLQASTTTPFGVAGVGSVDKGLEPKVRVLHSLIPPPPFPVILPLPSSLRRQRLPHQPWGLKGQPLRPKRRFTFSLALLCVCPYPLALIRLPLALIPLPCRQGSVPHPIGVPR
jgi:hypothetical protein